MMEGFEAAAFVYSKIPKPRALWLYCHENTTCFLVRLILNVQGFTRVGTLRRFVVFIIDWESVPHVSNTSSIPSNATASKIMKLFCHSYHALKHSTTPSGSYSTAATPSNSHSFSSYPPPTQYYPPES